MTNREPTLTVEKRLTPEIHYREETNHVNLTLPKRFCGLWLDGIDEPVSDLDVMTIRLRFGAVTVDAEGIGGVETLPEYRRQGYARRVLSHALEGMTKRVSVAFISEGIEGLYEKFGFVPCLTDGHLTVPVHHVERQRDQLTKTASTYTLRPHTPDDLPAMIALYNTLHANRPWTLERQPTWNRVIERKTWHPGSEGWVLEEAGQLVGYAILKGHSFGQVRRNMVVNELTAQNSVVAQYLLAEISAWCSQYHLSEFQVQEPVDSVVSQVARRLGCTYQQEYIGTGGMMGAILNRTALLQQLEPELHRRLDNREQTAHQRAFKLLRQGDLIPDNATLLRLLLGFWSIVDAQANGTIIPEAYERICRGWFPGGNTSSLPMPFAHQLDRY